MFICLCLWFVDTADHQEKRASSRFVVMKRCIMPRCASVCVCVWNGNLVALNRVDHPRRAAASQFRAMPGRALKGLTTMTKRTCQPCAEHPRVFIYTYIIRICVYVWRARRTLCNFTIQVLDAIWYDGAAGCAAHKSHTIYPIYIMVVAPDPSIPLEPRNAAHTRTHQAQRRCR